MISYKVKGIILAVIISLASIMMPFSVYADTITNSNVNINYYLDSVTETTSGSYMQTYKVEFVFDKSYLGWISSRMVGTYIIDNNVPITTSQFTKTQAIYINGTIAETSFTIVTQNTQNGGALQSLSQSIQNSNVTPLADLSTLDDILDILTDINNNIEIDVLEELQNIVANTSLSNEYLDTISKLKEYDIPFESVPFVYYQYNQGLLPLNLPNDTDHFDNYILFQAPANQKIGSINTLVDGDRSSVTLIIGTNINLLSSNIYTYLGIDRNIFYVLSFEALGIQYTGYSSLYINKIVLKRLSSSSGTQFLNLITSQSMYFIPIYFNYTYLKNISTDFALRYGLTNQLLDNLQIIANGTNQSNSAASDLESEASEYSEIADDVIGVEEGLTSNFETEVNKIDLNTGLNVFGGNFMTSATWVRTQFDRLTENTPYGSLVVYGLTLGFALLMLGKVFL